MKYKLSKYIIFSDSLNIEKERMLFASKSGAYFKISNETYLYLINNQFNEKNGEAELNSFVSNNIIVKEDVDEFSIEVDKLFDDQNKRNLGFYISLSSNCQFSCYYCGQKKNNNTIDKNIYPLFEKRLIDKINSNKPSRLEIFWIGGEPLLALDTIRDLSAIFIPIAQRYGLKYSPSIITNGYDLDLATFEELTQKFKIMRYQVTLDGFGDFHNNRRSVNGYDSFNKIFNNILQIINSSAFTDECRIVIRCNVDEDIFDAINPLLDLFISKNIHKKVEFRFEPVFAWGSKKKLELRRQFAEYEIKWIEKLIINGVEVRYLPQPKQRCCNALSSTEETIDDEGNIWECYMGPYTLGLEHLKLGNISDSKDERYLRQYLHDNITKLPCSKCELFPTCKTYCPNQWNMGEICCPGVKYNIKDRLKLAFKYNIKKLGLD